MIQLAILCSGWILAAAFLCALAFQIARRKAAEESASWAFKRLDAYLSAQALKDAGTGGSR